MNSTTLVIDEAPNAPGIYKITYKKDNRFYIGATRNIKKRLKEHETYWYSQQWKIDLCKELAVDNNVSFKEIYKNVLSQFEYEILKLFDNTATTQDIKNAEREYLDLYRPPFNTGKANYSERYKGT